MPKFQHIVLESTSPNLQLECWLGDGAPKVTDGYAGWEVVDRPKRRGLTFWKGSNPVRIEVPIMVDNFVEGTSIEGDCRKLEKMAGLIHDGVEPPLVQIKSGGIIPHDFTEAPHNSWVIEILDWGDSTRNRYGNRIRQAATITFLLYVDSDSLRRIGQRLAKNKKGTKIYTVKGSDKSLRTISKKLLGSASKWREIGNMNGIRDPKAIFENQRLRYKPRKR